MTDPKTHPVKKLVDSHIALVNALDGVLTLLKHYQPRIRDEDNLRFIATAGKLLDRERKNAVKLQKVSQSPHTA